MHGWVATILVLDDDDVIAQLLRTVIADGGDTPIVVQALDEVPPESRPDLVLTDLMSV